MWGAAAGEHGQMGGAAAGEYGQISRRLTTCGLRSPFGSHVTKPAREWHTLNKHIYSGNLGRGEWGGGGVGRSRWGGFEGGDAGAHPPPWGHVWGRVHAGWLDCPAEPLTVFDSPRVSWLNGFSSIASKGACARATRVLLLTFSRSCRSSAAFADPVFFSGCICPGVREQSGTVETNNGERVQC